MTTKDHKILSRYLIEQSDGFENKVFEKAFVLGSVEPDYNIFTYLKGSIKSKFLSGHHFNSSLSFVKKISRQLKGKDRKNWNAFDYYKLGKIIHYIADDFTFPHNENFDGGLFEHCLYELQIHRYLVDYLEQNKNPLCKYSNKDALTNVLELSHHKYISTIHTPLKDCKWITEMTFQTMCYFLSFETVSAFSTMLACA